MDKAILNLTRVFGLVTELGAEGPVAEHKYRSAPVVYGARQRDTSAPPARAFTNRSDS